MLLGIPSASVTVAVRVFPLTVFPEMVTAPGILMWVMTLVGSLTIASPVFKLSV